jgi:predicted ATPase
LNSLSVSGKLKAANLAEPTFVGRTNELSELKHFLELMMKGEGSTAFISGEAGSGKTRLANEFLDAAKTKGVTVLAGWCLNGASVPYFPFIEAFNSYESYTEEGDISFVQKISLKSKLTGANAFETSMEKEVLNPQIWKDQAFAAITQELLLLSTSNPIILFIDDIHWADSASVALLHYIARAANSERLFILATFRSEEISSNYYGQTHQLSEALQIMGREGLFKEIKLSNLSQSEVGRVAESMLGGKLKRNFVETLSEESRGNPLFVVESLRMIYDQDILSQEEGQWSLKKDKIGIPDKVKEIILRRTSSLKPNQSRILNVASVIGEKFDPKLVASALSESNLSILEELNNVAKSTLLITVEGKYYRFKHARIQEMIYNEISTLLKQEYHLKIAESLESNRPNIETVMFSDIAYHYINAKNDEKAAKYSLAAGQYALKKWSNIEAIRHFKYVLQILENEPETIIEKTAAFEGLGDAYFANNNFKEAAETFEHLAAFENGVTKLRALRKAMFSAWFKGDLESLDRFTKLAEQNATADRLEAARILHQKARVVGVQGEMSTCLKLIDQALEVFDEEYALEDAAWVLFAGGHAATIQGQLEKGLASSLRAIALYDELDDVRSQMEAYLYTSWTFQDCTLNNDAINMCKKVIQINDQRKMWDYINLSGIYLSWALSLQGQDLKEAISKTVQALELSDKSDSSLYLGLIYETLVMQCTFAGNLAEAEEYFKKLTNLPQSILSNIFSLVCFNLASAVFLAGKNQFEQSETFFKKHFNFLANSYQSPNSEAGARQAYAWALANQGKMSKAKSELELTQTLVEKTRKRFEHFNLEASLMTYTHPKINQVFEIRLDLVNISKSSGIITRIEKLLIPEIEIVHITSNCFMTCGNVQFKEQTIAPFQVKTIKLSVKISKAGTYPLKPTIAHVDDLGKTFVCKPRALTITVQPIPPGEEVEQESGSDKLAFASEPSKKAFDFLSKAYKQDYFSKKLPKENSGWRSLMQIAKEANLSKHSMYGQMGHGGEIPAELKRLGLVETRFFAGERGRGGNILKLRTCQQGIT